MLNEWNGFNDGVWTKEINVRNFIQKNYTLYEGDDSFLADVSQKTKKVWKDVYKRQLLYILFQFYLLLH